jgi:hypothetical protein
VLRKNQLYSLYYPFLRSLFLRSTKIVLGRFKKNNRYRKKSSKIPKEFLKKYCLGKKTYFQENPTNNLTKITQKLQKIPLKFHAITQLPKRVKTFQ